MHVVVSIANGFCVEEIRREHQREVELGNEEWKVHSRLQVHHEESSIR